MKIKSNVQPFTKDEQVIRLAEKYTYLQQDGEHWSACFKVNVQSFDIVSNRSEKEANWFCWAIAKAIQNILKEENENPSGQVPDNR